jgi:hypothetical protein
MYMKKLTVLSMLLLTIFLTGSCDFFRSIAGRPTSAEIEQKLIQIKSEEAAHKAMVDSLKKVEKAYADSLAVVDSMSRKKETLMNTNKLGGLNSNSAYAKYYIIIGSFMDKANAKRLADKVGNLGYPATLICFKNGYNAVGICPSGTLVDVYTALNKIKNEKFCPSGAWILANN